jgi:hypothetical protein
MKSNKNYQSRIINTILPQKEIVKNQTQKEIVKNHKLFIPVSTITRINYIWIQKGYIPTILIQIIMGLVEVFENYHMNTE